MMFIMIPVLLVTFVLPCTGSAVEFGGKPLTRDRVMELAASAAPEVRVARTQVAEEEARLDGAKVRTLENPELELEAGPRSAEEDSVDFGVGLEFPVELWGRRDKRIAVAEAVLQRETFQAQEARRQAVSAALGAYFQVLHDLRRVELARRRLELAEELLRIAVERHRAGEAPRFEVNLARSEAARASSEIAAEEGRLAGSRTALAQVLGLPADDRFQVEGDLADRSFFAPIQAEIAIGRSDLLAARADVQGAEAGVALARAELRPDLALRLGYRQEGDEKVALAGIAVGLPFLNPRDEAPVRAAQARLRRARITAESRQLAVSNQVEGARLFYEAAVEAVRRMEKEALPLQRENQTMATESYRSGKIDLATLLQVRREALETRREYLDRLLSASEAGVGLASAVGTFSK
jgi:cobalt-zinc-cadmium efflux system outer membrane protein